MIFNDYNYPDNDDNGINNIQARRNVLMMGDEILCTILNGKFIIYFVNQIELSDNISKIILECIENKKYQDNDKSTLFDAYEYLNRTHFIEFLVAKDLGLEIWAYEGIDIQLSLVNNDSMVDGKIIILIETSPCPDRIREVMQTDCYCSKYINYNNIIEYNPFIERVLMKKGYYNPIIAFDISLGFYNINFVNFETLHYSNFYNLCISKYIRQAILQFYPELPDCDEVAELGEKLVRASFKISYIDNLMSIELICIPSVLIEDNRIQKYLYNDNRILLLKADTEKIHSNDISIIEFMEQTSSSDNTQIMVLRGYAAGNAYQYYEDYRIYEAETVMFAPNRYFGRENQNIASKVYTNLSIDGSESEMIHTYWIPPEPIIENVSSDGLKKIKIFGFINFNTDKVGELTFMDVYHLAKEEINNKFGFTEEQIKNKKIFPSMMYQSDILTRICLFSMITITNEEKVAEQPKKNTPKNKKKFKLFG